MERAGRPRHRRVGQRLVSGSERINRPYLEKTGALLFLVVAGLSPALRRYFSQPARLRLQEKISPDL
jgi:hypothetical protein